MVNKSKGNKIDLNTFKNWGKGNIIGYKTSEDNGRLYVTFSWCKVCARNKDSLFTHPNCKGSVKANILSDKSFFDYVCNAN